MTGPARYLRYTAAALLAAFCLAFARADTTEKSMVRALLLQPGAEGWTVGLLYQVPEASADAAEATDGIRFAAAEGPGLGRALDNAEGLLPMAASYRLCDYLLLAPGAGWEAVKEYEALVLARGCGRTSARLAAFGLDCAALSEATEEGEGLLTRLLQTLKQQRRAAPRLYEAREGGCLLLPLLTVEEGGPAARDEGVLLSAAGREEWEAGRTALCRLLTGRGESFTFWLGEGPLVLRRPLLSVEAVGPDSFALRLDCQTAEGSARPTPEQLEQLGALADALLAERWAAGEDLVSLGAHAALRWGEAAAPAPSKNACPQLRTDVRVY